MATVSRRFLAVISGVRTREKGFIFAKGVELDRAEYFVHISGVNDDELFAALQIGDGISCEVETTPKGFRAHKVLRATEAEQAVIDSAGTEQQIVAAIVEEEENRGNR